MVRVSLELVRNPKVSGKVFVAKVKSFENYEIEFIKALIPKYYKSIFIGGEYDLEPNQFYILREDLSSHKHAHIKTSLITIDENGNITEHAYIHDVDKNIEFSNDELKEIYMELKKRGENNLVIKTLIEYAKRLKERIEKPIEEIIKREIESFVKQLEEKYGVKINISISIQK